MRRQMRRIRWLANHIRRKVHGIAVAWGQSAQLGTLEAASWVALGQRRGFRRRRRRRRRRGRGRGFGHHFLVPSLEIRLHLFLSFSGDRVFRKKRPSCVLERGSHRAPNFNVALAENTKRANFGLESKLPQIAQSRTSMNVRADCRGFFDKRRKTTAAQKSIAKTYPPPKKLNFPSPRTKKKHSRLARKQN